MPSWMPDSTSKLMMDPSALRSVIWWKSWVVTVNTVLAMWKVWVVSHHLSASTYTRMPLVKLSKSKHMMGSKPATYIKALVSFVKARYHAKMRLTLPLPKKGVKAYERQEKEHKNHYWIRKISEKKKKSNWVKNKVSKCQHVYAGSLHTYACWGMCPYELMNTDTYAWILAMHAWTQTKHVLPQFQHAMIKTHPKHFPTLPKISGSHLNSSHNENQTFSSPKTNKNKISKQNLKMRKVWKTYQSSPYTLQEMILWPAG